MMEGECVVFLNKVIFGGASASGGVVSKMLLNILECTKQPLRNNRKEVSRTCHQC